MNIRSLLIALILTFALLLPANAQDKSITTPAYFGDIDTLFNSHRHIDGKWNNGNENYQPYTKDKDQILGTIIYDSRVDFSTYLGGNIDKALSSTTNSLIIFLIIGAILLAVGIIFEDRQVKKNGTK